MSWRDRYDWRTNLPKKYICRECISKNIHDYALLDFLIKNEFKNNNNYECCYCNGWSDEENKTKHGYLSDINQLFLHIYECITKKFDPISPYKVETDGDDGFYFSTNTEDILRDSIECGEVLNDACDFILSPPGSHYGHDSAGSEYWNPNICAKGEGREHEQYFEHWCSFCYTIMFESRYFFFNYLESKQEVYDKVNPLNILERACDYIKNNNMFFNFETSKEIFRVRVFDNAEKVDNIISPEKELGTPPIEYCNQSNRMSPAGIPMFYGALNKETAVAETYDPNKQTDEQVVVAGLFNPSRSMILLDLTKEINYISLFDEKRRGELEISLFVKNFISDLKKPISRENGIEHIEYIPTQVVTEYIRQRVKDNSGNSIDGIIYGSVKGDDKAVVLFVDNERCVLDIGDLDHEPGLVYKSHEILENLKSNKDLSQ